MATSDRPNLLFVFADQLRSREIDDPAHPLITPGYDRMREEGIRCTNATANCPVCTPSRAILLTGQYPFANRVPVNDIPLPEDAVTIGDVLRGEGYRTGYIGKWHLDGVPRAKYTPPGPRRHGFGDWRVHNCIHHYLHSAYYDNDDPELRLIPGYEPVFQTDQACEIVARKSEEPFCLFLSYGPPHNPYEQVPSWFADLYDPATIELPPNFRPPDLSLLAPGVSPRFMGDEVDRLKNLCQYHGATSALDHELMKLLDCLDATDQAGNTIVVYTSDHGDMLWSHGRVRKQQPWEESVHVPLVLRWPEGLPCTVDVPDCLGIVDLMPTLLGLMDVSVPDGVQGTDLSAVLRGESHESPSSCFIFDLLAVDEGMNQGVPEWRGVRTQRYTYARRLDGTPWVLYDNLADPYQQCNLAAAPEAAPLRQALETELQGWLQRAGDGQLHGEEILRELDLIGLWNDRERELRGDRARLLE